MPDVPGYIAVKVQIPRPWMPFLKQLAKSGTCQSFAALMRSALIETMKARGFSVVAPRIDSHVCSECKCPISRTSNSQKTCRQPPCVRARKKRMAAK